MKRTERIDNDREVALPLLGQDVFTTVGELKNTPEQEEEKLEKTLKALRQAEVKKHTDKAVIDAYCKLEHELRFKLMPLRVIEGGEAAQYRWFHKEQGLQVIRDHLDLILKKRGGPAVLEIPIFIPFGMREEAEAYLDECDRRDRK